MKTIQLSERELSMILNMLTPPYPVRDTHTDEFNELRNKVFYALRDAQNDEPVSNRDELPEDVSTVLAETYQVVGVMAEALGVFDDTAVQKILDNLSQQKLVHSDVLPFSLPTGNSPVIPDGYALVPVEPTESMIVDGFESEPDEDFSEPEVWEAYQAMSGCQQAAHRARLCWAAMIAAAPKQE